MKKEIKLKSSGFTLMELMVTLSISAILLTLAVPSFKNLIQDNRAYTQVNKMHTALMYARSEAVKTGKNVSVCLPEADNSACGSTSLDWSGGWAVFDSDNNILRSWEALSGNPVFKGPNAIITFSSTGEATDASCFTLAFPDVRQYSIKVEATGRSIVTRHEAGVTASCP